MSTERNTLAIPLAAIIVVLLPTWAEPCLGADEPPAVPEYERIDDGIPEPSELEEQNATIGEIGIRTDNIFDLDNPLEDKLLYRWANGLHVVTKPKTIRTQLLFEEGDRYSERLAEETERNLRQNRYLRDASVEPVSYEDGVVDLEVRTTDVWSLTPSLSLGRAGGENRFGAGLKEHNLLGTGVSLGFRYKRTVDRTTASFDFANRHIRGSRYQVAAKLGENSDGFERRLFFAKPFYSLDTRRAGGLTVGAEERIDPLYERGEIVSEFNHRLQHHELFFGRSAGLREGWVHRFFAGAVYDDHEFAAIPTTISPDLVPPDRKFVYPFVGVELVEDHFDEVKNLDQIGRVEDRFLGTRLAFRVGYSDAGSGSSTSAWHFRGGYSNAFVSTKKDSLSFVAELNGRYHDGDGQNVLLQGGARYHHRLTEHQVLYASLSGSVGRNLDLDNQLLLGGDNGLRGYPLRYQGGDSMALLTLEHRIFTDWFPFRLFNVGGAIFFDAGRTWGENPVGGSSLGLLRDVGVGLRLGNNRSSQGNVLHIDLAFPLDGDDTIDSVQILIDVKTTF